MADPERIVIDASTLESIDFNTYFNEYFSGLGNGTRKYYGAERGSFGYVMGDQAGINWSTTDVGSKYVLIEGEDFGYGESHTYSGEIDKITFGSIGEETVIPPDVPPAGEPRGLVTGVVPGLVISNLDVNVPAGGGLGVDPANPATYNELYAYITLIRDADKLDNPVDYVKLLYDVLATKAQHFIGTDGDDTYTGTAFDDLIDGGAGNDTLNGGDGDDTFIGGAGDDTIDGGDGVDVVVYDADYIYQGGTYSYTVGQNGELIVTDSRVTDGTGTDTLTDVEFLRFNNLTYDNVNHRVNYVPTNLALDTSAVEGDAAVGSVVGSLTVTDQKNGGVGGPSDDTHTLSLVDDAGGQFEIVGTQILVKDGLAAGDHTLRVKVIDGAGHVLEKSFTITVSNLAPEITSDGGGDSAALNVAENTAAVTTIEWADGNGRETITYSLSGADAHLFKIDAETGALSFKSAADFEDARDAGGDNVYDVVVRATDSAGAYDEQALAVTVADTNDAPEITANGGGATAWAEVVENTAAVMTVTARDVDAGATLTYSLEGADKDLFTIDADGVLSFKSGPDFENAKDAGKNNVYDVTVKVSDGELSDSQALKIEVTDVNDNAPVITSGASVEVAENKTAVTTVKASDADAGATLSYSLEGADKDLFTIDANGVVSFKAAPDFEKPKDAGKDNVYDVNVKVSDGTLSTTQALQVEVTDVNDNAPRITSNGGGDAATVKVAENKTAVTTVKASDADAGAKLTYSLAGADHKLFTIDAKTGALSFKAAPDFEAPKDAGKDNVYDVTVKVSDGTLSDTQALKIEVVDVKGKTFTGTAKANALTGTAEADTLNGGAGNDTLKGGAGNDKLQGGAGADKLYGEAGADHFIFRSAAESTVKAAGRDTIFDFDGKGGDRIDLSGFDANSLSKGVQDFSFIGTKAFSGNAGELRYETSKTGSDVYADTNGDGKADFAIHFDDAISFQKGYFLL